MLDPQVIVNLFPQVCVRMGLMNHDIHRVCVYLVATAMASANKMIGQMAMNRTIPNATSSDK
jgi:hypothetical protein